MAWVKGLPQNSLFLPGPLISGGAFFRCPWGSIQSPSTSPPLSPLAEKPHTHRGQPSANPIHQLRKLPGPTLVSTRIFSGASGRFVAGGASGLLGPGWRGGAGSWRPVQRDCPKGGFRGGPLSWLCPVLFLGVSVSSVLTSPQVLCLLFETLLILLLLLGFVNCLQILCLLV